MIAQQMICHFTVILCAAWISLGEPQIKGGVIQQQISSDKLKDRNQQGRCAGSCHTGGKDCTESCDPLFHGKKTFLCPRGWWEKSAETCATLDVQSLLQRISNTRIVGGKTESEMHSSPSHGSTLAARDSRTCAKDFSCIIRDITSAPSAPGNIAKIVTLLKNISLYLSTDVTAEKLASYSKMANHILNGSIIPDWAFVSDKNASSVLLESVVSFAGKLPIHSSPQNISELFIATKGSRINKNTPEKSFKFSLGNSTSFLNGTVTLPQEDLHLLDSDSPAISVAFPTLGSILETTLAKNASVNGMLLSVMLPKVFKEVSLTFEKMNKTGVLKALCVGWHTKERRWDPDVCELQDESSATVMCCCQYQQVGFQSFSILMSPKNIEKNPVLAAITCVGLAISICSLVLCLVIEAVVWHQVTQTQISYMRHVCLVNIAVSLLVADSLFIVAAFVSGMPRDQNHNLCVAVTFFVHFFYLSLFFWMLALGLLILYGLLLIFWHLRKSTLLTAAFGIGYGGPSIIALLTVAITESWKGYLRDGACWLNWNDTKALLAFTIPAVLIIGVNMVVVLVVIARSGRSSPGDHSNPQELVTVIRVSKNVALLTPLLGLTWVFGLLAFAKDTPLSFHVTFSLLNAFQGFFILLFGILLDRKTRESLRMKFFPSKTPSTDATGGGRK